MKTKLSKTKMQLMPHIISKWWTYKSIKNFKEQLQAISTILKIIFSKKKKQFLFVLEQDLRARLFKI